MYTYTPINALDETYLLDFLRKNSFATLVILKGECPIARHIPLRPGVRAKIAIAAISSRLSKSLEKREDSDSQKKSPR